MFGLGALRTKIEELICEIRIDREATSGVLTYLVTNVGKIMATEQELVDKADQTLAEVGVLKQKNDLLISTLNEVKQELADANANTGGASAGTVDNVVAKLNQTLDLVKGMESSDDAATAPAAPAPTDGGTSEPSA